MLDSLFYWLSKLNWLLASSELVWCRFFSFVAWENCLGGAGAGGTALVDDAGCTVSYRRVDALPAGE